MPGLNLRPVLPRAHTIWQTSRVELEPKRFTYLLPEGLGKLIASSAKEKSCDLLLTGALVAGDIVGCQ